MVCTVGAGWPVGLLGRMSQGPAAWSEKTFDSEYGELHNVHMKERTIKLYIHRKFAAFFNISAYWSKLSRTHEPAWSNCILAEKFSQFAPDAQCVDWYDCPIVTVLIQLIIRCFAIGVTKHFCQWQGVIFALHFDNTC